jgi:hypothetical protein
MKKLLLCVLAVLMTASTAVGDGVQGWRETLILGVSDQATSEAVPSALHDRTQRLGFRLLAASSRARFRCAVGSPPGSWESRSDPRFPVFGTTAYASSNV